LKLRALKPSKREFEGLQLIAYSIESEIWEEREAPSEGDLLSSMLTLAQNAVSKQAPVTLQREGEGYVCAEVEYPGLRAVRCEGSAPSALTILYPIPKPVKRVVLLKKEGEVLKPVKTISFEAETWVYDTAIASRGLDFDALLIETSEDKRLVLKEELEIPVRSKFAELVAKPVKKRRRRARKTKTKTESRSGKKERRKRRSK